MTETVDGHPIWRLDFDKDGDVDPVQKSELIDGVRAAALTDLVLFSHGWNNDEQAAKSLYERWFHLLSEQVGAGHTVGYVGIRWPAQLWRDEPIPDFDPAPTPDGGGAAAATVSTTFDAGPPTIGPEQLADLKVLFPNAEEQLDKVAALLAAQTSPDTPKKLFEALREFSAAAGESFGDGEADKTDIPGMLDGSRDARLVFDTFAARLSDAGARFPTGDGAAGGLGDFGAKLLHGAKEALRQASYWQMKNRAGVVGEKGVGPLIAELSLSQNFPNLRIHLIGHSFGARVVSYALAGLPASGLSQVKAVTLLQGAYSRFAFADPVPFGLFKRKGALVGRLDRVDGPFTVCFSSHDRALGTMYPLASMASGDNASAGVDPLAPWRAMGSHGAFDATTDSLGSVGKEYQFQPGAILNLNSSDIVIKDAGPSGAHSDIFHKELAWVAALAGQLN